MKTNRYFVILSALLIQLALGSVYAWSIFTPTLISIGWSKIQTQWIFAITLFSFSISMVLAGRNLTSWGPRKLTIIGGITFGTGTLLAGLVGNYDFFTLLILIGFLGGAGIGITYVVPIAVGLRWFPDKKGLISGVAVAGFGFGSLFWIKLAGSWGNLLSNYSLDTVFIFFGAAHIIMILFGSMWMKFPVLEKPSIKIDDDSNNGYSTDNHNNFTTWQMLQNKQFYLIFFTMVFSAGAGLMSIGLMQFYPVELLMNNGLSLKSAQITAGTAMAVFFSLANGIGRIAWGYISDYLGRKSSLIFMTIAQGLLIIFFKDFILGPLSLYLLVTIIGFNFGGNFALFPAITADTFGERNIGANYPFVFLAYGFGGVVGPILGGHLGESGNFHLAFTISGFLVLLGTFLVLFVKPAKKKE